MIIVTICQIFNFTYLKLDIKDNIVFQIIINQKCRQILKIQVLKYGYWQKHKLNTLLSNEKMKLQSLLQINYLKSIKAIVRDCHFYMLIEGHDIDNNIEKICK